MICEYSAATRINNDVTSDFADPRDNAKSISSLIKFFKIEHLREILFKPWVIHSRETSKLV